jgi:hypothetical protein
MIDTPAPPKNPNASLMSREIGEISEKKAKGDRKRKIEGRTP